MTNLDKNRENHHSARKPSTQTCFSFVVVVRGGQVSKDLNL